MIRPFAGQLEAEAEDPVICRGPSLSRFWVNKWHNDHTLCFRTQRDWVIGFINHSKMLSATWAAAKTAVLFCFDKSLLKQAVSYAMMFWLAINASHEARWAGYSRLTMQRTDRWELLSWVRCQLNNKRSVPFYLTLTQPARMCHRCFYLYVMIDPLHWCKSGFGFRKEPHGELKQASQLDMGRRERKWTMNNN